MILSPAMMPALAADTFSVVPVILITGLASANASPNPVQYLYAHFTYTLNWVYNILHINTHYMLYTLSC